MSSDLGLEINLEKLVLVFPNIIKCVIENVLDI